MTSAIARLNSFGQSPWYDNLSRGLLDDGTLAGLIADHGIRGVTSNPTILEQAIAAGDDAYMPDLSASARENLDPEAAYWRTVLPDIERAAELLLPVHAATEGADGFVSIEVSPALAHDTTGTIEHAIALFELLQRPNVMVKIPATREGLPAITAAVADGVNVNVTLIFSLDRYADVIDAYLDGLEQFAEEKGDLTKVSSVASFFVSRVDTETDRRLPEGHALRGRAAIANARLAYNWFQFRFASARWGLLAAKGARVQRPLWASTSTKNPAYPITMYVDELIGADTVDTLAPASIAALQAGEGNQRADTVTHDVPGAKAVMEQLAAAGIDFADVTATLEREGVEAFAASFERALTTIEQRMASLAV